MVTTNERQKRRMVINYSQAINRFTLLDAYPLPRIDDLTSGWYRVALDVTYRLLSNWGYGEAQGGAALTPFTAQIWLARFALLIRIRNYEVAERELATFGTLDAPNVYFESAPDLYPGRSGSIIPFSLRLVHAELPFHLGRSEQALDRLYHLIAIIGRVSRQRFLCTHSILKKISKPDCIVQSRLRVDNSCYTCVPITTHMC
ncbi:unnamed protein product [Echinostoma caproni]|uniref:Uncharacterized protein n=1 Tax=Echinostoma caproni TaxID=27848 RepID=A0A3P8IAJ9_9TREM|nr:unnamed protein product [Echinostoma caproni]